MVLDFGENALIAALALAFPARHDRLATLTGIVTGLKFCAYLAVAIALTSSSIASIARGPASARDDERGVRNVPTA